MYYSLAIRYIQVVQWVKEMDNKKGYLGRDTLNYL
jgi:hypothetical protein